MPLVLSEEETMLRESARDFLAARAPVAHLRTLRDDAVADGFSRDLWGEMADMGWPAVLVPEDHGGLGLGAVGLGVILEECGRTLTPSPLLSSALVAATAIAAGGSEAQRAAWLPAIADGSHLFALACDETARHDPAPRKTKATPRGDRLVIDGAKRAVHDGHVADTLLVTARLEDRPVLVAVPAGHPGVHITPSAVLDTHRAARVVFDQVEVGADALLGDAEDGGALIGLALDAGRIGAAAELLGVAREAFERTLAYLGDRRQFGVPIGSFQALQHRAAQLWCALETGQSVLLHALKALDARAPDLAAAASLAKAQLSATAHLAATEAIQMHGGIGMTDEFDIGFFLKRQRILEALWGDRHFHLDRYARERGY